MIGRLSKFLLISLVVNSCTSASDEETCKACELEADSLAQLEEFNPAVSEQLMKEYIDSELVPEAKIYQNATGQEIEVDINGESHEILTYEGQLMEASIHGEGVELFFKPYEFYDEDLEKLVESEYKFALSLSLNSHEKDVLDLTENNPETNNIQWDFLENLFLIYLYIDENQVYHPLKVMNQGKTDWDG